MMKLLLIDDDQFLRDMYAIKFTEQGFSVKTADQASVALSLLKESDFDVILLDLVLPTMSGIDLIKLIKKDFPNSKAKCVVLSNLVQDSDRREALEAGAVGYIVKADSIPSEVVKKVQAFINK